jgi:hypothetical protein
MFLARDHPELLQNAFVSDSHDSATVLTDGANAVLIASGSQHLEGTLNWLSRCHEASSGSSFVLAQLRTPRSELNADYVDLHRLGLSEMPAFLQRFDEEPNGLVFLSVATNEVIVVLPVHLSVRFYLPAPVLHGLEIRKQVPTGVANAPVPRSGRRYDPIAAQISEVLNRRSADMYRTVRSLRSAWQAAFPAGPILPTAKIEEGLDNHLSYARDFLATDPHYAPGLIDASWKLFQDLEDACSSLTAMALQRAATPDPWRQPLPASNQQLLLKACDRLVDESRKRAHLGDRPIVVLVGGKLRLRDPLSDAIEFFLRRSNDPSFPRLIEVPRTYEFRIGALPLVAHETARCALAEYRLGRTLEAWWNRPTGRGFDFRSIALPSRRESSAPELPDEYERRVRSDRMQEVMCDLIGCLIVGPAYLYAMCRFATGTLEEFTESRRASTSHVPLPFRASICLDLFAARGIPATLRSRYFEWSAALLDDELRVVLDGVVPRPYDREDHDHALSVVQPALLRGEPVEATPSQVLNAMWDAVIQGRGYANEIAAAWSLLGL